jgi:hypothetical protein
MRGLLRFVRSLTSRHVSPMFDLFKRKPAGDEEPWSSPQKAPRPARDKLAGALASAFSRRRS